MELSGGKAEDIALGFKDGLGGIVNASRSLMAAYKSDRWKDEYLSEEYGKATRAEAIRMRDELNQEILKWACLLIDKTSPRLYNSGRR